MEVENEIWRNISGCQDYQVSNMGRVKSLKFAKERILKPIKNRNGYLQVVLYKGKKIKTMYIHRLVCSAFVQNDSLFNTEINHIDENKENNCASNLEWCEHIHNINFGTRNERAGKSKSKPVICIETGKIYPSTREIQRQLGFSQGHICDCCNKKYGRKTVCGYHWEWAK